MTINKHLSVCCNTKQARYCYINEHYLQQRPLQLSSLVSNGCGGVNVLRPHGHLRSLLLCRKTNMLGAPLVRVNINTPVAGPGGQPGVSSPPWWRDGWRAISHSDSRTNMASDSSRHIGCGGQLPPGVI